MTVHRADTRPQHNASSPPPLGTVRPKRTEVAIETLRQPATSLNAQATADLSIAKLEWWRDRYFSGELRHFWPEKLDDLEDSDPNPAYKSINREDVFAVVTDGGPHVNVRTAVAAYVWGVGKSAYQVGRLVRAFTRQEDVEERLDHAAEMLRSRGAVAAYASMMPGGPNQVKYMGPAYFTKFLFFIGHRDPATPQPGPLILDKRVATALRRWDVVAGWPDSGWTTAQYNFYLTFAHEQPVEPEDVEKTLFAAGNRQESDVHRPTNWNLRA